ncbi:ribbon-helix-helix domain-containing protein [Roseibium litorale]|uniref:Ribbon-helix-helix domain-containing protein n=1 Tax=Roseibium litorale TaxID=2803841 RepID=A0ABR9CIS8_9HYPH|nr:ribbon-helix-helix domain-containing protein [Roseibium litorale]MBD8890544.1 ribbon-helix-helix domain-containing protein [Roseibium litorale]
MALSKRSLSLHGHRTSVALEPEFWAVIDRSVARRDMSLAGLVAEIDESRDPDDALSSALRVFALREALAETPGGS